MLPVSLDSPLTHCSDIVVDMAGYCCTIVAVDAEDSHMDVVV